MRLKLLLTMIFLVISMPISFAAPLDIQDRIVLIDTSGSMKGERLIRAQDALIEGLKLIDNPRQTLVYSFDEQVKLLDVDGKSEIEIRNQLQINKGKSHTRLYDSIMQLLPKASSLGFGITVISDGNDSSSSTNLSKLINSLTNSNVRINFVPDFIDPAYLSVTESLSGAYIDAPIQVRSATIENNSLPLLAALIALGSALISFLLSNRIIYSFKSRAKKERIKALLTIEYKGGESRADVSRDLRSYLSRFLKDMKLPAIVKSTSGKSIAVIGLLILTALLTQLFNSLIIAVIFLIGALLMVIKIQNRHEELMQRRAFERELPAALRMLASSLTAGMSFLQALSAFAEDDRGPCAKEFKRALVEIQYGAPIEKALDAVATRMTSEDLRWAVSAFTLQREVGGSLAAILNSTAQTIESRFELRREVRTLSAEGRISSYILMALPIGIFAFLSLLRPQYVSVFITEPVGNLMLILILLSLTLAWFWLRALVRISI